MKGVTKEECAIIKQYSGNPNAFSSCFISLLHHYDALGDYPRTLTYAQRFYATACVKEPDMLPIPCMYVARAYARLNQHEKGRPYFERSYTVRLDNPFYEGIHVIHGIQAHLLVLYCPSLHTINLALEHLGDHTAFAYLYCECIAMLMLQHLDHDEVDLACKVYKTYARPYVSNVLELVVDHLRLRLHLKETKRRPQHGKADRWRFCVACHNVIDREPLVQAKTDYIECGYCYLDAYCNTECYMKRWPIHSKYCCIDSESEKKHYPLPI